MPLARHFWWWSTPTSHPNPRADLDKLRRYPNRFSIKMIFMIPVIRNAHCQTFLVVNRPNYARWGTLFLQKLRSADDRFMEILEKGAFSIQCTKMNFSRSAIVLSLEQTANLDAASSMRGIVAFCNSQCARRRWHSTPYSEGYGSHRAMDLCWPWCWRNSSCLVPSIENPKGSSPHESPECKDRWILQSICWNPPNSLVNLASGKAASGVTEKYLLNSMKRGEIEMVRFQEEWEQSSSRFLKPIKRLTVHNFATENVKKKQAKKNNATAKAESLRYVCSHDGCCSREESF